MKKISFIILSFSFAIANAQVIIGDAVGTAAVKTSVLLEFAKGSPTGNRGIVLPYVTTLPTSPTEGTLLLDCSTAATARVKFYNGTEWKDLSGQDANLITPIDYMFAQPTIAQAPELASSKAIIGAQSSTADGVLVLESNTKAMVLPTVNNTDQIINPSPGMLVYINKTGAKRLAVFNGSKWSYWKP